MEETGGVPLVLRRITLTKSMLIPAENVGFLIFESIDNVV